MKRTFGLISILALSLFATSGMAATASFWATATQSDNAMAPDFLSKDESKSITINYSLGSNWVINSAKLWLRAVDDYNGDHCAAPGATSTKCNDDNFSWTAQDTNEQAKVTIIEGLTGTYGSPVEINTFKWYDLNINVASFLSSTDNKFNATIKAVGGDFWYKNSKIVIDYSLKPVPVPAAVWLFGSAFLGLIGKKRKFIAPAVA